jgi:Peptide N-acetyl-beta-D-glucosaminyl asparaginase amidase A
MTLGRLLCAGVAGRDAIQIRFHGHPFAATLGGLLLAAATTAGAQPVPFTPPTIGSANTAVADPPIARPHTTPCKVALITAQRFADFSAKFFDYSPPAACPGPWQKVVLEADYSVEAGRQFDRTATLWIGGANIYFGTTAEPSHTVGRAWHIERDLTEYSALLTQPSTGRAELGNLVNSTYTSSLWGTAALYFYPREEESDDATAPAVPDHVLPLSASATGGTVALFSPSDRLSATFALPSNIERAAIDVVLQHQGANDEFWYTCVPNALASELQSCTGTAFREGELTIDGQPAGVVPIRPWIFSGGIDPLLWRPIPSPQALNFESYRVDVTPFAASLSDGQPHTFAITVFNDSQYFQTTANLLLWLDHGSAQVTGGVTKNTIGAPAPAVTPDLTTAVDGTVSGTVDTSSTREFVLAGRVVTSHGPVDTEIHQKIDFDNLQQFVVPPPNPPGSYVQNIKESTEILSTTVVHDGAGERKTVLHLRWPLVLDFTAPPDGTFVTSLSQSYTEHLRSPTGDRSVSNSGQWHDDYPSGAGQAGKQCYLSRNNERLLYGRELDAASGVLTAIVDGQDCSAEATQD